nr:protein ALP1-like [Drosophila takahashii]
MPGATHDSFAWNMSLAREFLQQKYDSGSVEAGFLGTPDPLEPFVLTPYRSPAAGTGQHLFNLRHASARNVVERTIGVLKSRFRSLRGCLLYHPLKVSRIINVCSALHNLCRDRNDPDFDVERYKNQNDAIEEDVNEVNNGPSEASSIRDEIKATLRRR